MQRSLEKRLEALEAMDMKREAKYIESGEAALDALSDDDVLELAIDGLREYKVYQNHCWYAAPARDSYWTRVAERANDVLEARQVWIAPLKADEAVCAIRAMQSGQWRLRVHGDHLLIWFEFVPPEPYPDQWYKSPEYAALKCVVFALRSWQELWRDVPDAPALPRTMAEVVDWLCAFNWGDDAPRLVAATAEIAPVGPSITTEVIVEAQSAEPELQVHDDEDAIILPTAPSKQQPRDRRTWVQQLDARHGRR